MPGGRAVITDASASEQAGNDREDAGRGHCLAASGQPRLQIVLQADEGEAERDGLEVFAVGQALRAKAVGENAADRGNERTAAGEEDAVDRVDRHTLGCEEPVDGLLDPGDVRGDPALEIRSRNRPLDREIAKAERISLGSVAASLTRSLAKLSRAEAR